MENRLANRPNRRAQVSSGTAAGIIPVVKCDGRPIGDGKPGPVFRQLRERFLAYVRG